MSRACRIARVASDLLRSGPMGLVGLVAVVAAIGPSSLPDVRLRSEPDDPERTVTSVTLRVPEGELSGTLVVVDARGGEVATLTQWHNGDTSLVARRSGGTGVSAWLKSSEGSARLTLTGAARETRIVVDRDGETTSSARELPSHKGPPTVSVPRGRLLPSWASPTGGGAALVQRTLAGDSD